MLIRGLAVPSCRGIPRPRWCTAAGAAELYPVSVGLELTPKISQGF